MKGVERVRQVCEKFLLVSLVTVLFISSGSAWAQNKVEKTFNAIITDTQGVETDVKNLLFYWEEKISETAFVPHEQKHVPVKRGTTTALSNSIRSSKSTQSPVRIRAARCSSLR